MCHSGRAFSPSCPAPRNSAAAPGASAVAWPPAGSSGGCTVASGPMARRPARSAPWRPTLRRRRRRASGARTPRPRPPPLRRRSRPRCRSGLWGGPRQPSPGSIGRFLDRGPPIGSTPAHPNLARGGGRSNTVLRRFEHQSVMATLHGQSCTSASSATHRRAAVDLQSERVSECKPTLASPARTARNRSAEGRPSSEAHPKVQSRGLGASGEFGTRNPFWRYYPTPDRPSQDPRKATYPHRSLRHPSNSSSSPHRQCGQPMGTLPLCPSTP